MIEMPVFADCAAESLRPTNLQFSHNIELTICGDILIGISWNKFRTDPFLFGYSACDSSRLNLLAQLSVSKC